MTRRRIFVSSLLLSLASTACAGHMASVSPNAATSQAAAALAVSAYTHPVYDVHVIIDESGARSLGVSPHGLAPQGTNPIAVPGAIVRYPDGSVQIADVSGTFSPATSSYAVANGALLESDAEAAPYVVVFDPANLAAPLVAQLDAAAQTAGGNQRHVENAYAHILDGSLSSLTSVVVYPSGLSALDGQAIPLEVDGIDSDGHVASVAGAGVTWSQPAAGRIVPFAGTPYATYYAPASGSGIDTVHVSVAVPDASGTFDAEGAIVYSDPSSLADVRGSLNVASGTALQGTPAFEQRSGIPSAFAPPYWFATRNPDGSFSARLPKNATFTLLALGGSPASLYPAYDANGNTVFGVASDPVDALALSATFAGTPFADGPRATPPISSYIRDAWFASSSALERHVYDADSGIQPLLAAPSNPSSGSVAAGLFKNWRFQWSSGGGVLVLTLVESDGQSGGRRAATIALSGANSFRFTSYSSPSPLSLALPLVAAQPGTIVRHSGEWSQSAQSNGTFSAQIDQNVYSAVRQSVGSPQYVEHVDYQCDSLDDVVFTETFKDAAGRPLWTIGATRAPAAIANAASTHQVYSYTATMQRFYNASNGAVSANFLLSGTTNGDGSGDALLKNAGTGVTIGFHVDPPSANDVASGGLVRDASGTAIATFGIDKTGTVLGRIGIDPAYGFAGRAISFGL